MNGNQIDPASTIPTNILSSDDNFDFVHTDDSNVDMTNNDDDYDNITKMTNVLVPSTTAATQAMNDNDIIEDDISFDKSLSECSSKSSVTAGSLQNQEQIKENSGSNIEDDTNRKDTSLQLLSTDDLHQDKNDQNDIIKRDDIVIDSLNDDILHGINDVMQSNKQCISDTIIMEEDMVSTFVQEKELSDTNIIEEDIVSTRVEEIRSAIDNLNILETRINENNTDLMSNDLDQENQTDIDELRYDRQLETGCDIENMTALETIGNSDLVVADSFPKNENTDDCFDDENVLSVYESNDPEEANDLGDFEATDIPQENCTGLDVSAVSLELDTFHVGTLNNKDNDLDEDDGFGDFEATNEKPHEPVETIVASSEKATMKEDDNHQGEDDEFGDFEAIDPSKDDPKDDLIDDDEFGDFGDFDDDQKKGNKNEALSVNNDDEFGDFDNFGDETQKDQALKSLEASVFSRIFKPFCQPTMHQTEKANHDLSEVKSIKHILESMFTETENINQTNFSSRDSIEELFDHTNSMNVPSTVIVNSNQIQDYIISFATTKPQIIDSIQPKQPEINDIVPVDLSHILESQITQNDDSSFHNEEASCIAEDSASNEIDIEDDFGDFETSIQDIASNEVDLKQVTTSCLEECITNNDMDDLNINEGEADVDRIGSTEEHTMRGVDRGQRVIDIDREEFDHFQRVSETDMGEADFGERVTTEGEGEFYDFQGTDTDFGAFGTAVESAPIDSIAIDDVQTNSKASIGDSDFDVFGDAEETPTTDIDQAEKANSVIDDRVQGTDFSVFDPNTEISQTTINAVSSNDFDDFLKVSTENEVQVEIKTYDLHEEGNDDDDFGDFHESSHEVYESNDTALIVNLPTSSVDTNDPYEINEFSSSNIINKAPATTISFDVPSDVKLDDQGPLTTSSSNVQYSKDVPSHESSLISDNVTAYNDHSKLNNMLISSQNEIMSISQVATSLPKYNEDEFGDFSSSALEDAQANNWDRTSSDTQKDGGNDDFGEFHDVPGINGTNEVSNNHVMGNGTEKNAITDAFSIFD